VLSKFTFTISPQLTYESDTQGRIINELSTKWIWYKKHYFRICRGEKLIEISWSEIEKYKYNEEATPPRNEICDSEAIFIMNNQDFDKMINVTNYERRFKRKPQTYKYNYNSSKCLMNQDISFRLKPGLIGILYNKFYEMILAK
jgi:hypothetical protein